LYQVQIALDEILRNFPSKIMGLMIRVIIFPLGLSLRLPNDGLGHRVAAQMIKTSVARENLTQGLYNSDNKNDITGCLEYALKMVEQVEPIEKRLKAQRKFKPDLMDEQHWMQHLLDTHIINEKEKELLMQAEQAILKQLRWMTLQ
jgi:acyl-CoA dehydrogenase